MKKLILGVVIAAVAAVAVYFAFNPDGEPADQAAQDSGTGSMTEDTSMQNQTPETAQPETASMPHSLRDLLTGGAQICTFSDGQNSGTVYAADGKARINGTTVDQGETVNSNIIVDADAQMVYIWADGQPQGMKMSLAATQTSEYQAPGVAGAVDIDREVDYECGSWDADGSFFAPPATVEFMDFSSMQMGGMQ